MSNRSIPRDIIRDNNQIIPGDNTQGTPQVYHRLSLTAYQELERKVSAPIPDNSTTDIRAGYLLGIQHVLKLLRDGFVVGT